MRLPFSQNCPHHWKYGVEKLSNWKDSPRLDWENSPVIVTDDHPIVEYPDVANKLVTEYGDILMRLRP